jgi:hypothetical protein
MKKRCLGIILSFILIAVSGYSEPPPAAYKEAVQRQLNNKFKFHQQWTVVDGPGTQPLIQTYRVEAAN